MNSLVVPEQGCVPALADGLRVENDLVFLEGYVDEAVIRQVRDEARETFVRGPESHDRNITQLLAHDVHLLESFGIIESQLEDERQHTRVPSELLRHVQPDHRQGGLRQVVIDLPDGIIAGVQPGECDAGDEGEGVCAWQVLEEQLDVGEVRDVEIDNCHVAVGTNRRGGHMVPPSAPSLRLRGRPD